jgi:hypothetical protein
VFAFFEGQHLTPEKLRELSQRQIGFLAAEFDALELIPRLFTRDRSVPLTAIGGCPALRSRKRLGSRPP